MICRLYDKIQRKYNYVRYLRKKGAIIGDKNEIYSSANFGSEPYLIKVGNHVRINEGVQLITHDGGVWVLRGLKENMQSADLFNPIEIGNNVHIGTNAIIMPGVRIGNNCIVGCGAVVTRSIPDGSIAVGVPARVVETVEEYLEKHVDQFDMTKNLSREKKRNYLTKKYHL